MSLIEEIKKARRCSTPIIRIVTPDPLATMRKIANDSDIIKEMTDAPKIAWDILQCHYSLNQKPDNSKDPSPGEKWLLEKLSVKDKSDPSKSAQIGINTAPEAIAALLKLPQYGMGIVVNAHRFFNDGSATRFIQAIMAIRDRFKTTSRNLFLLTTDCALPIELQHDVISLIEDYPNDQELASIIDVVLSGTQIEQTPMLVCKITDAIRGLPPFPAEQVTAMASTKGEVDLDFLWKLKENQIKNIRGLHFDTAKETFDDLGGLFSWKEFTTKLLSGRQRFKLIVRLEEIEKALAGAGGDGKGDSSGVSAGMLGHLLETFEDNGWTGALLYGVEGSGKSLSAKALGNTFGIKTLVMDISAAKDSLVGSSEANIREQTKAIKAIGGSDVLFLASANGLGALPPALKRRFKLGVWFFNLPTREERAKIWDINMLRFEIPSQELPNDALWTGADIRNVCEIAYQLSSDLHACSLIDAAKYIVPISKSDPGSIEDKQHLAHNRFLSASDPGIYQIPDTDLYNAIEGREGRRNIISEELSNANCI